MKCQNDAGESVFTLGQRLFLCSGSADVQDTPITIPGKNYIEFLYCPQQSGSGNVEILCRNVEEFTVEEFIVIGLTSMGIRGNRLFIYLFFLRKAMKSSIQL